MTAFLPKFLGRVALVTTVACTPFLAAAQSPDTGFAAAPVLSGDGGRTGALRAPLNIIPAPMQAAIGGQEQAPLVQDKLAPTVAARQSKRAVRAVAAAPGAAGGIVQVGSLGSLQDAPVGLETGFGTNLWRGARLAFIAEQMRRLPENIGLLGLRDMELSLHRGATAAPVGTVDGTSWYAARLNRFLALGDTQSVLALEQLTGAATNDGYAAQALVRAHLGQGNAAAACAVARPKKTTAGWGDTLPFFMRVMVYCQLRGGEYEKASLALELNERTLGEDAVFRDIAYLLAAQVAPVFGTAEQAKAARAAGEEPPLVLPDELTALQIMLLKLAGQPLPASLSKMPPYMAAAVAADYGQMPFIQLRAALMAARHDAQAIELFSQVAQLADLSRWPDPYAVTPDSEDVQDAPFATAENAEQGTETHLRNTKPDGLDNLPEAIFLAHSLRFVDMQPPAQTLQGLATALRQAHQRGLWADMVRLLADRLTEAQLGLPKTTADTPDPSNTLPTGLAPLDQAVNAAPDGEAPDEAIMMPLTDADRAVLWAALYFAEQQPQMAALTDGQNLSATSQRLLDFGKADTQIEDLLASLPLPNAIPSGDGAFGTTASGAAASANTLPSQAGGTPVENLPPLDAPQPVFEAEESVPQRLHPIADFAAYEAAYAVASPAEKAFMARELAVYHGLQYDLSAALLAVLPLDEGDAAQARFANLADKQWTGDLLLALVAQYGGQAADDLSAQDIVTLLQALRQAGLEGPADRLGREVLSHAAATLAVAAPQSFVAAEQ